jgi:hypothetical protein
VRIATFDLAVRSLRDAEEYISGESGRLDGKVCLPLFDQRHSDKIPRRCHCRESEASSLLTARALTDQPVSEGLSKHGSVRCGDRVMSLGGQGWRRCLAEGARYFGYSASD